MNGKIIGIGLLGLCALALAPINTGCTKSTLVSYNTNALGVVTGITNTETHLDMAVVCPIAENLSMLGTGLTLQYEPQYRPAFVAARDGLRVIANNALAQPQSMEDVLTIINALPIQSKQIQGTNGTTMLIASGGLTILQTINGQILKLDKQHVLAKDVGPFAQCVADGMTASLGP